MVHNERIVDAGGDPKVLSEAVHELERAEAGLVRARAVEAEAEGKVKDAIEKLEEAQREHDRARVTVHVVHVNETERASFKEPIQATLQKVWDDAYVELKIERRPKDVFQTGGEHPKSLMSYLGLTLAQAHEQVVITDYRFGIASETGGA